MAKKLILDPRLIGRFGSPQKFFSFGVGGRGGLPILSMLYVVASYHCMQFQGKLMNQTWEKCRKPNFGLILARFGPNLVPQNFFSWVLPILFFFKNLALSVTRYHGQLLSCAISEKTNDPILRKFSDGRTDRRTDGRE